MGPDILERVGAMLAGSVTNAFAIGGRMLLSPSSSYSLVALGLTLAIAAVFTLRRRSSRRPVPLRVLARALLPRRMWRSASGRTDLLFTGFNIFLAMALFGWAILAQADVAAWTQARLPALFGPGPARAVPGWIAVAIATFAIFMAYEFAYWFDHWLSHKIPLLWRFHQVHHSADSLSLATNFRVHPVDSIVFYNLVALFCGGAAGLCRALFGKAVAGNLDVADNALMLTAAVLLTHLQHTHLWISFGPRWGRVLLSPAHHQIHHSSDPVHHDRNFGNSLAIFDRIFGTLHVPDGVRQPLRFGVHGLDYDPHGFRRSMAMPFAGLERRTRRTIGAWAAPFRATHPRQLDAG